MTPRPTFSPSSFPEWMNRPRVSPYLYTHLFRRAGGSAPCGRWPVAPGFNPGNEAPHPSHAPSGATAGAECRRCCGGPVYHPPLPGLWSHRTKCAVSLTAVNGSLTPVTAHLTPVRAPLTAVKSSLTPVSAPLTPVRTNLTPVRALLTAVKSSLTPVSTPLTPVREPLTGVRTSLTPVRKPLTPVRTSLTPVRTNLTPVRALLTAVKSNLTPVSAPLTGVRTGLTLVRKTPVKPCAVAPEGPWDGWGAPYPGLKTRGYVPAPTRGARPQGFPSHPHRRKRGTAELTTTRPSPCAARCG